ncbi:hypothetical protein OROHE_018865 [Orobanche hederae]
MATLKDLAWNYFAWKYFTEALEEMGGKSYKFVYELSMWILDEEVKSTQAIVNEVKTWSRTGVLILSDGWKDIREKNVNKEFVHPAATRICTTYLTLESMSISSESLERMSTSLEWGRSSWSKNQKGEIVKDIILSYKLLGELEYAIKSMKALVAI